MAEKFREALFNEIKGSLFEYLCAHELSRAAGLEVQFLKSLPSHYQRVLEQQDHMTRELYPELLPYLPVWARAVAQELKTIQQPLTSIQLTGQLIHTESAEEQAEADFMLNNAPVSLKLNKRQGSVNTKSGGIKSLFTTYFPCEGVSAWQESFNQMVDSEFAVVRFELHQMASLTEDADWKSWRRAGLSELPGELPNDMRERLHAFYARVAEQLTAVLKKIAQQSPEVFTEGLVRLCGFGVPNLIQVTCFHELHGAHPERVDIRVHDEKLVRAKIKKLTWKEASKSSCEFMLDDWHMQIRVKPMNKFTTTAIKMNCSLRF